MLNPNVLKIVKNGAKIAVSLGVTLICYEAGFQGVVGAENDINMIANEVKPGVPVKVKTGLFKTETVVCHPISGKVEKTDREPVNKKAFKASNAMKAALK